LYGKRDESFDSGDETKSPTIEIVVARYNEDLHWLKEDPFNKYTNIVYNKSDNTDFYQDSNTKSVVQLPNVGREMHTYFYHIIENYDNLSDVTVFLPGSTDLPHKYNRAKNMIHRVAQTNSTVMSCSVDTNAMDGLKDFSIDHYLSSHSNNKSINTDTSMQISDVRPFGKWYESVFSDKVDNHCVSYNSIISISKKHIHQHPISYYKQLMDHVDTHQNPETVHYFERAWYAVFFPYDSNDISFTD
jgi:hypothetical protein